MEREGGAVPLLLDCEIVEEPTDVGEEEVADLGFVLERRLDLGKRVFQIPVFIAKGKRRPDLFEARRVLPRLPGTDRLPRRRRTEDSEDRNLQPLPRQEAVSKCARRPGGCSRV